MRPATQRVLTEGLVAGLIGYGSTVLFFGALNLISGKSFFYTAALLGRELTGVGGTADVAVTAGSVLAYNGVHVLLFLALGLVAAWAALQTARRPGLFGLFLFLALGAFFLTLLALATLALQTGERLSWGSIAVANGIAAFLMAAWLFAVHPRLWSEIRAHADSETEHPVPTG
jgi:hypothetical protein